MGPTDTHFTQPRTHIGGVAAGSTRDTARLAIACVLSVLINVVVLTRASVEVSLWTGGRSGSTVRSLVFEFDDVTPPLEEEVADEEEPEKDKSRDSTFVETHEAEPSPEPPAQETDLISDKALLARDKYEGDLEEGDSPSMEGESSVKEITRVSSGGVGLEDAPSGRVSGAGLAAIDAATTPVAMTPADSEPVEPEPDPAPAPEEALPDPAVPPAEDVEVEDAEAQITVTAQEQEQELPADEEEAREAQPATVKPQPTVPLPVEGLKRPPPRQAELSVPAAADPLAAPAVPTQSAPRHASSVSHVLDFGESSYNIKKHKYGGYYKQVRDRIVETFWGVYPTSPVASYPGPLVGKVEIAFDVSRDGKMADVKLLNYGKDLGVASVCLEVIKRSAPLPVMPDYVEEEKLAIKFGFIFE